MSPLFQIQCRKFAGGMASAKIYVYKKKAQIGLSVFFYAFLDAVWINPTAIF